MYVHVTCDTPQVITCLPLHTRVLTAAGQHVWVGSGTCSAIPSVFSRTLRLMTVFCCCSCRAVADGVRLTHFFAWSFTDNWEWKEGFGTRFGLVSARPKSCRPSVLTSLLIGCLSNECTACWSLY